MDSNPPFFLPTMTFESGGSACWGQGAPVREMAVADFNSDGIPDVAMANCGSGTVGVLLGNHDGSLQPAVITYAGESPTVTASADLNDDGHPDLVVALGSGGIGVLLGNGDGTFQPAMVTAPDALFGDEAVADLNGDGKPDLILPYSGVLRVLLGNGDGTFRPAVDYNGGPCPNTVWVSDVNRDGKPDLLASEPCWQVNTVAVLLGNGDGSFKDPVTYDTGAVEPEFIATGDVNGDGKPDLAVSNWCSSYTDCEFGSVAVLLGNGDGTFQTAVTYGSGGGGAGGVAIGDVHGNGKPDLLVVNWNFEGLGLLAGNGDGTFQPAVDYDTGGRMPEVVVPVDVNGDGKLDLVIANVCNDDCLSKIVAVLLRNGTPVKVVSSWNPAPTRGEVIYTATVTVQNGEEATGTVTFDDGGSIIAIVSLDNNQAACSARYKKGGSHEITASYSGDLHYARGMSGTLTEYISSIATKTALTTSGSPSRVGQPVTFTAEVTSKKGVIPDGEVVTFYDGKKTLGSVGLANGKAAYTTSSLAAKVHNIKATYAGDTQFKPSTGRVKQVVEK